MAPSTGPRVLCVDDDRDIAEIVQAVLADEGYAISCLYSTENDALRRIYNDGGSLSSIGFELLVLAAWAILGFGVAIKVFRWQ